LVTTRLLEGLRSASFELCGKPNDERGIFGLVYFKRIALANNLDFISKGCQVIQVQATSFS